MKFLDYLYYRICDYYKKKKDSTAETTGVIILTLIECFFILDILVIFLIFGNYPFLEDFNKYWGIPPYIIIAYINWKKYMKYSRYDGFREIWKEEDSEKREINGISIVLMMIVVFSIPLLYGFIKHNILEGQSFWSS